MASVQAQSRASEEQVRAAIAAALAAQEGQVQSNVAGSLIVDVGGPVGAAYLAGGFRKGSKMPMRISVSTSAGPGGTELSIEVGSRGTGGGLMSGGLLGASKQKKAAQAWLDAVIAAIPERVA